MRAIPLLMLSTVLLSSACAPPPARPRGLLDLSNAPEPGANKTTPTLGPMPHTGSGPLGGS